MKNLCLALTLLFSLAAVAQENHFSVDASALDFAGPGSAAPATIVGGEVNLTERVYIGYEQVLIPSRDANYYFGKAGYRLPLASLVGKNINSKLVFDSSKWNISFFGGLGQLRQNIAGVQSVHIAGELGACGDYLAGSKITLEVVCGRWLRSPVSNEFLVTPNVPAISSGLKLTF